MGSDIARSVAEREVLAGEITGRRSIRQHASAKVDVTFGQDIDGIGGKAGMRISW
jgi:hypothetical protein